MRPRDVAGAVLVPALLAVVSGACSEHYTAPGAPIDGDVAEIVISNFAFALPAVTIDRGTSVRWRNSTSTFHTVSPDGHQAFPERQTSTSGETFQVRFDAPGTYRYYCAPHRTLGMSGEVVVR